MAGTTATTITDPDSTPARQLGASPTMISDDEVDQAVGEDSRRAEQSMDSQLAEMIPIADEPLDPSRINDLADAIRKTNEAWGVEGAFFAEEKTPIDQVPIELGKFVIAFAYTAADQAEAVPSLAPLVFDPTDAMASNKGLIDATMLIRKMGDSNVVDELQGAADGVQDGTDDPAGAAPGGPDPSGGEPAPGGGVPIPAGGGNGAPPGGAPAAGPGPRGRGSTSF